MIWVMKMKNKILIELIVPEIDIKYNLYIPINKKIGNIIVLLNKAVKELSYGIYEGTEKTSLYNKNTGEKYSINNLVRETDIKNGSCLILI